MLRFIDSFDHYATSDISEKWTSAFGVTIVGGSGRRGTSAVSHASGGAHLKITLDPQPTWILGMAIKRPAIVGAGHILYLGDTSSEQCGLFLNLDGTVTFRRGLTPLSTSTSAIQVGVWTYVELKVTVHNTLGSYEVRFNGESVLSASNVDTQNTANAYANVVCLISRNMTNDAPTSNFDPLFYDDVYVCDGVGTLNKDFLGDVRIDALLPTGPGAVTQFVPSVGMNYDCVNEAQPNDDSDIVTSDTVGDTDVYAFANIVHPPTSLWGVQVLANAKKDDSGDRTIATVTRSGETNYVGVTQSLGTAYKYHREIRETDPATSQLWTKDGLNNAEHGIKVVS